MTCPAHVHHVRVGSSGMVKFEVNPSVMTQKVLEQVQTEADRYGLAAEPWTDRQRQRVIVEFSSPNIAKPFHAGHLRSTLIGNCIANLHNAMGNDVIRMNYMGDWGVQFGLLGVGFQRFGSEEELAKNPIQHLFDVYVRVNEQAKSDPSIDQEAQGFNRSMEKGDSGLLDLWKRFRDLSTVEYSAMYRRLGVTFDEYAWESQYGEKAHSLLGVLKDKGLLQQSEEGTSIVDLSDLNIPQFKYATVKKSDGTTLYLTRDIAAAIDRYEAYSFDGIYYVVDKSQEGHFSQMKGILEKMNLGVAKRCHHIMFGRVLGMQTRTGNVVLLRDILDEAKNRMLHNMQETSSSKQLDNPEGVAEQLGVSAMIVQDLKGKLINHYHFDWNRILTSQGDTGVFLQYTHARLHSLEQLSGVPLDPACDSSILTEPEATLLAHHLSLFRTAISRAHSAMEPSHLTVYLLQLCHFASSAIKVLRVKDTAKNQAEARLLLFNCARQALANGMKILGIAPVNKM
ncbi:probable arginine--tRNA ligase, mitochondrial isoform X2 [Acanthaster planci]|nr:probable arginine--tRNA ligase, mitochondrial isoform X2 [Acanthaster planci]XP_022103527.1 probable arginine--tRNA ligase, mitochondrial isoform X2 [Acanthaster planci]XP_022103528.1 probable arginine--tRNA ligase, mitochondrial isoform X2 [Acanthaster planci]